jgi:predicted DNA-binding transcriptional regulator YafY
MFGSGYGIFSGDQVSWAVLRFTPEKTRWVASERWHLNQKGKLLDDGSYELHVPYADDRELIMDILKYGSDCSVIEPKALKDRVARELRQGLALYPE